MIHSFLKNRSFQVNVQGKSSVIKQILYGVPQGAVLSPTLYNVYTHDIPITNDCNIALFADDLAFYVTSRFAKTIVRKLESTAKKFLRYYKKWKIKLNETKTQAIFFTDRLKACP